MNWLRANAVIIEAAATVVLAVITAIYVWLVHEQLKHIKETARVDRQQYACALALFAFRLRETIGSHLGDVPTREKLLAFFLLPESDITELRVLARKVNGKAIDWANQAAVALRVMHGIIQKAKEKDINEMTGWQPTDQEKETWKKARSDSERALHALQEECGQVAGIDVNSFTLRA